MESNPKLKLLKQQWYKKLSDEGFEDIEYSSGLLKQGDRRSMAFENREMISEFFTALDHYLTDHPEIPEKDREILSLYSQGLYATQIQKKLRINQWSVKKVIKRYKEIILGGLLLGHQGS